MGDESLKGKWALILGVSSGFGAATARALAAAGMNVAGVHLDMRATLPLAKAVQADIEAAGGRALFFNTNAADADRRTTVLDGLQAAFAEGPGKNGYVHVFMHSLAFGSLLPFIADKPEEAISQAQMDMTSNVMAHSLVYWVQDLVRRESAAAGEPGLQHDERGQPPGGAAVRGRVGGQGGARSRTRASLRWNSAAAASWSTQSRQV